MKIKFNLTKQDYINFNKFHITNSKKMKINMFKERYLAPIIFLIAMYIICRFRFSSISSIYWVVIFISTYLSWILFYPKYINRKLVTKLSKMFDKSNNTKFLENKSLVLSDDEIIISDNSSQFKTKYDVIKNIIETKDYIFVYLSDVSAFIIPIRAFQNDNQKKEFLDELHSAYTPKV